MLKLYIVAAILGLIGCSGTTRLSAPHPQTVQKAIEAVKEQREQVECSIPSEYLAYCLWPLQVEDDSIEELQYVTTVSTQRAKECYILHNELVRYWHDRTQSGP